MKTSGVFPVKTVLAVAAFAVLVSLPRWVPAMKGFAAINFSRIPDVWDLPVPEPEAVDPGPSLNDLRRARAEVLKIPHNPYLADEAHALDHFFESLEAGRVTRVLHFGDSPTTADLITADARSLLQKEYGDAGHGFVLMARPWAWYNHRGVEMEARDWGIEIAGQAPENDGAWGLGGARFSGYEGAEATWRFKSGQHRSAEVAFMADPYGGDFEFLADGEVVGSGQTWAQERTPGYLTFDLPEGTTEFSLRVTQGFVELFGVEFRKNRAGVIYSSLGINGANIMVLSRVYNRGHLSAQLRHYRPDLVVLGYGTNESGFKDFVETNWAPELAAAVERVRAAVPEASILLMSPMDRGVREGGEEPEEEAAEEDETGELGSGGQAVAAVAPEAAEPTGPITTIATMPRLVAIEGEVAAEQGVAFFNTFEAMGGEGTMARWYESKPRLVGADFIHPLPAGAKIVGGLLYEALQDGYNEYKLRKEKESIAPVMSAATEGSQ